MSQATTPLVHQDPDDMLQQDGNRVAEYTRWRSFARGEQWATSYRGGPPRQMTFNYARALIRKTASYVFSGPATFTIPTPDAARSTTTNPDEQLLAATLRELDLASLDLELEIERSTIGDAAIKVTWDQSRARPRVVAVDPATLSAKWSPDNPREARSITQTYNLPGWALLDYGIDIKNPDAVVAVHETWSIDRWTMTVTGTDLSVDQENPFGWIPYVILPNNPHPRRFWGSSDLLDLVDVSVELNRELSVLSHIMELSGAPIAVLENVDGSDGITTRPGAKWELPENSRAYLLDLLAGQGVRLHTDYIDQLRTTMHDLAETPRTAFGDTGRALSGTALEVEIQPLVQRVGRKRASWDRFYRERNRRLLDLVDTFGASRVGRNRTTETIWHPVLPSDDDANVRNQVQLVAANIRSRYSAGVALGDSDPENELERIIREHQLLASSQPQEEENDATATTDPSDTESERTEANNAQSSNDDDDEDDQ